MKVIENHPKEMNVSFQVVPNDNGAENPITTGQKPFDLAHSILVNKCFQTKGVESLGPQKVIYWDMGLAGFHSLREFNEPFGLVLMIAII